MDERQIAAATAPAGPLLIAGPSGSGKSEVLKGRALRILNREVAGKQVFFLTRDRHMAVDLMGWLREQGADPTYGSLSGSSHGSFQALTPESLAIRWIRYPGFMDEGYAIPDLKFPGPDWVEIIARVFVGDEAFAERMGESEIPDFLRFSMALTSGIFGGSAQRCLSCGMSCWQNARPNWQQVI